MSSSDNQEINRICIDVQEDCPVPVWIEHVFPFVETVLTHLDLRSWELSILFCKDPFIQKLNAEYRNMDMPTDVLSFEQGDTYVDENGQEWFSAGDIVISIDTLQRNSETFAVPVDDELKRLLIHGILHLDGYDHADNSPEQEMLQFQEKILAQFADVHIIC